MNSISNVLARFYLYLTAKVAFAGGAEHGFGMFYLSLIFLAVSAFAWGFSTGVRYGSANATKHILDEAEKFTNSKTPEA